MWFEVLVGQGHGFVTDTPIDGVILPFLKKLFNTLDLDINF